MDLEGIMLSREISQAEKNKYHMSLLIYRIKKKKTYNLIETEQIGGCQRWEMRGEEMGEG